MASDVTYAHNPAAERYEARIDGAVVGFAEYTLSDQHIEFVHTVVDDAHQGGGIAGDLAKYALDDVAADGSRRVVASCPYIKLWLRRHPEYQHLQD